jgi:hypothetical protein
MLTYPISGVLKPDTEDFHSFLVVFRKFIMPGWQY